MEKGVLMYASSPKSRVACLVCVVAIAPILAVPAVCLAQICNTATGYAALTADKTGSYDSAYGFGSLSANTSGSYNSALGYYSLGFNTSGYDNTAAGYCALCYNTTGFYNTANGCSALIDNTTGAYNTASGVAALCYNSTGLYNSAIGFEALYRNTIGYYNTASGANTLYSNTTGSKNVATGFNALYSNTIGFENTANGNGSLYANTSGSYNTAAGFQALTSNTTGSENTAYGEGALGANTTGIDNVANGFGALTDNTTGIDNTADGFYALGHNTTGTANIALGTGAGYYITTGNHNIDIGNEGIINDSGVIRIGAQGSQTATFVAGINGVTAADGVPVYITSNGQLGTITSSRRFKFDIKDIGATSDKLMDLRPVAFRYKEAAEDGSHPIQYGLIAEEVAKVYPDLVQYDKQGKPFTVYYNLLTPMMLNELQKAHHQLATQQTEFTSLKATVQSQNAEVASLRRSLLSVVVVVPGSVIIGLAGLAFIVAAGRRRVTSWRTRTAQTCA